MYNYIIISPFFVFKLVRCNLLKKKRTQKVNYKRILLLLSIAFKDETQHWLYQPNSLCR